MSLQTIIDKAQQIEFDRRRIVGQTVSRSQRIKTAERSTSQPWRFKVTPPGMLKWEDSRGILEVIDFNDRVNEYTVKLSNSPNMNWITEYQGALTQAQLNNLTIYSASTASMSITNLPAIGATLTSRTYVSTAQSFTVASSVTYNRALSTSRSDFLITTDSYNLNYANIQVGDTLSVATYLISGQTVSSITYNYITIGGVSYTRIVMSAPADANSTAASVDGGNNIFVTFTKTTTVSSSTVIFSSGDVIQPDNSRYPYSVVSSVIRGSNTTTNIVLHRPVITSEAITLAGENLKVGNSCTWQLIVSGLPTYQLVPGRNVQYTGDFELIEKII